MVDIVDPFDNGGTSSTPPSTPPAIVDPFDTTSAQAQPKGDFSWGQAVTDIPSEIGKEASSAWSGITDLGDRYKQGPVEGMLTTGKAALSVPRLLASPITGAARSLIGHPMANLEHQAGELINPAVAEKDNPSQMYEQAKQDVDTAMSAARPAGIIAKTPGGFFEHTPPPPAPTPPPKPVPPIVAASDRLADVGAPVNVPKAIASDSMATQRAGQVVRNIPFVGNSIPRATGEMADQMGAATDTIASNYGQGSGPNVASRVGNTISNAANVERTVAETGAQTSNDAVLAAWQRAQDDALQQVGQHENTALTQARAATGDMSPQDMGQALIERLTTDEQAARARKDALYATADTSDASVTPRSVRGVHGLVTDTLNDAGRTDPTTGQVDPLLLPASNRMMQELHNFSASALPTRDPDTGRMIAAEPITAQAMEQTRKRLGNLSQAATNDADRAAARIIVNRYDEWQGHAYDNALFSGSPQALQDFRNARAANRNWRQTYYNDRDDADRLINRVVTGEVTPQEMSNWIVGSGQVGAKGTASRLITRIGDATAHDPAAMDTIRSGVANRLFGTTEGATPRAPERNASDINEFFNGSGRDVANRLFSPQQRQAALNYADAIRRGQEAREDITTTSRLTKPTPMDVGTGPMQELASTVLGKNGKTDEALFSAIDAYSKSGGRGDIQTLSDIVRSIPEKDKGDLAGAIIRKLGQSNQIAGGGFSPEKFVTEWNKYTPQAKTILFGNAGPHRQALDDLAAIAQRYKEVGRRFGNPSGTAQNVAGFGSMLWLYSHPFTAIPTLIGGKIFARMLSAPATAKQTTGFFKAALDMATNQTAGNVARLNYMGTNFARSAAKLGASVNPSTFMHQMANGPQGPGTSNADENKPDKRLYVAPGHAGGGSVRLSPDDYNTKLNDMDELAYRSWVKNNNVPTNPDAQEPQDYDMRGFWQGQQQGNPKAQSAVDPNDNRLHYPDYWKTPLHPTFSNESQWAKPDSPSWTDDDKLVSPGGQVLYDDRAPKSDTPFRKGGTIKPVPESDDTLKAQQKQLIEGHRHAQLFPGGKGELPRPKGVNRLKTPNGDVFHYRPGKITPKQLHQASKHGTENEVLGLGPVTKHEALQRTAGGEMPLTVVERNPHGTEVRASAGTHRTAPAQMQAMHVGKSPSHTISVEHPWHTIIKRKRAAGGKIKGYADGGDPDQAPVQRLYVSPYNPEDVPMPNAVPTAGDLATQASSQLATQPQRLPEPTDDTNVETAALPEIPDTRPAFIKKAASSPAPELWPERMIKSGVTLAHDVMTGEEPLLPPGIRREDYTDIPPPQEPTEDSTWLGKALGVPPVASSPYDRVGERVQDMAALAGSGGLGAGAEEGATLGSAPFLRPALKYEGKIYKAPTRIDADTIASGNIPEHLDAMPPALYPEFQRQAMSGEDISNFDFGYMNHKGQFLDRPAALDYAVNEGMISPHDAKYGTLTSTMFRSDTTEPGAALSALENPNRAAVEQSLINNKGGFSNMGVPENRDPNTGAYVGQVPKFQGRDQTGRFEKSKDPYRGLPDINADQFGPPPEPTKAVPFRQNGKFVSQADYYRNRVPSPEESTVPDQNQMYTAENAPAPVKSNLQTDKLDVDPRTIEKWKNRLPNTFLSDSSVTGAPLAALEHQPFYSAVEKTIQSAPQQKMHGVQWANWLKNQNGVKPDELQYTGIDNWLRDQKGPVTKQQVQDYIGQNKVHVNDVVKGGHKDWTQADSERLDELERNRNDLDEREEDEFQDLVARENAVSKPGGTPEVTKYSNWQLPGGENYREHLLTLPQKEMSRADLANQFRQKYGDDFAYEMTPQERTQYESSGTTANQYKSGHWNEPNILAHVRTNDRDVGGVPAMHIEELQSDWHQAGRKNGYQNPNEVASEAEIQAAVKADAEARQAATKATEDAFSKATNGQAENMRQVMDLGDMDLFRKVKQSINEDQGIAQAYEKSSQTHNALNALLSRGKTGVPDAPFKTSWPELAMKRMIAKAVDEGKSRISWTPGDAQAARYDLSKQVSKVHYVPDLQGGTLAAEGLRPGQTVLDKPNIKPEQIADYIGKEAAEKLLNTPKDKDGIHTLEGESLKIGGEGMKGFYDQMMPKMVEKLGKPYGIKVKEGNIVGGKDIRSPKDVYDILSEKDPRFRADHPTIKDFVDYWNDMPNDERESLKNVAQQHVSSPVHYFDIPKAMADKVKKEGFPLFSDTTAGGISSQGDSDNKKDVPGPIQEKETARASGGRVVASNINHNPTPAQQKAGNYSKDKVHIHGLQITIENAKGSTRSGAGRDGKKWSCVLSAHYGYFNKTEGKDGDHVDCYLGPHIRSNKVYVVNQVDADSKEFDEHKVILGTANLRQALETYEKAFSDGKGYDRIGSIVPTDITHLKEWLKTEKTKKPFVLRRVA